MVRGFERCRFLGLCSNEADGHLKVSYGLWVAKGKDVTPAVGPPKVYGVNGKGNAPSTEHIVGDAM